MKKTRVEHWSGQLPKWDKSLRTWGEAGVVTKKSKQYPKLKNRGVTCMLVGYTENHTEDVYRMWNPVTGQILTSRDVTWLQRMYYRWQPIVPEISAGIDHEIDGEVGESDGVYNTNPTISSSAIYKMVGDDSETETVVETSSDGNESIINPGAPTEIPDEDGMVTDIESDDEADNLREIARENESTENNDDRLQESDEEVGGMVTRSGRVSRTPKWMRDYGVLVLTEAEMNYQTNLKEMAELEYVEEDFKLDHELVGVDAGLCGGFENTNELKVMK